MGERIINEEIDEITELKTIVNKALRHTAPIVVKNDISIIPENVRMWQEYNCKLGYFKDIFSEQTEHEQLKGIFLELNRIAKLLKIEYEEIPIGVFCSCKEDLTKLEHFLAIILHRLKENQKEEPRRKKRCCWFCC